MKVKGNGTCLSVWLFFSGWVLIQSFTMTLSLIHWIMSLYESIHNLEIWLKFQVEYWNLIQVSRFYFLFYKNDNELRIFFLFFIQKIKEILELQFQKTSKIHIIWICYRRFLKSNWTKKQNQIKEGFSINYFWKKAGNKKCLFFPEKLFSKQKQHK